MARAMQIGRARLTMSASEHIAHSRARNVRCTPIGELARQLQVTVRQHNAVTMAQVLQPDLILVLSDGRTFMHKNQRFESQQNILGLEIQDQEARRIRYDVA
jgi:hypothetical protein